MIGCLYLSTSSAKAAVSPCFTRNIRAASESAAADILATLTDTGKATRFRGTCVRGILRPKCLPMQELLKKIEANAAVRLALPPGRQPAQELARYKAFLKVETHRVKLLH